MPLIAFCAGCCRYIQLTDHGECPHGHPRSSLRNVRDGVISDAPAVRSAIAAPTAEQEALRHYDSFAAKVAGKTIVILPVVLVLAWGIWTGMEQFSGSGMPWIARLAWSVLSLALTVGLAFFFYGLRRRR